MTQIKKPLVGVVSDRRVVKNHHFHMVGEKYLHALIAGAGVYPVAIPSLSDEFEVLDILDRVDGLFCPEARRILNRNTMAARRHGLEPGSIRIGT